MLEGLRLDLSMHRFCLLSPSGSCKPIGSFLIPIIAGVAAHRTQPLYRRGEFHSVICGCGFASCEHPFRVTTSQNATPSARPGIADSRTVHNQLNLVHCLPLLIIRYYWLSP